MAAQSLTVAVTGPTGDLGIAIVDKLERARSVKKVVGMARRPFDPAEQGWKKTEYRQGDVQDAGSVRDTVKDADVLIHLAFSLMGEGDRTRAINVDGSRTVFEAAAEAGVQRICYASSVAAYGFHADNPLWLTEEVPARGTAEHFYSAQKAEVESVLGEVLLRHQRTAAYVFRPCVVAGPRAQMLLEEMPYYRISGAVPDAVVGPAVLDAHPQAGDPRSRRPVPAGARGRRGQPPSWPASAARASRAPTTWPGRAPSACPTWPTSWAGTRSRCPSRWWASPPASSTGCPWRPSRCRGSTRSASPC